MADIPFSQFEKSVPSMSRISGQIKSIGQNVKQHVKLITVNLHVVQCACARIKRKRKSQHRKEMANTSIPFNCNLCRWRDIVLPSLRPCIEFKLLCALFLSFFSHVSGRLSSILRLKRPVTFVRILLCTILRLLTGFSYKNLVCFCQHAVFSVSSDSYSIT